MQVTPEHGPLLQESNYYPYGLGMAGISSSAITNAAANAYKANGGSELGSSEWADGKGLELYETTFRNFDAQIGRFMQVDPLMESTANLGGYVFGGDNPAMFIDPAGLRYRYNEGGPPDQGTGDNPGYLSQWEDIFNVLYYGGSGHGGSWTSSGGVGGGGGSYNFFDSDADAFMHGSMDMDQNHSWGNDGFATNFQDAQKSYYKNGGTDANVGYLAPTVYLKGFSKQAITNLDAQIARNAGLGFGDNKNEESNGWETTKTVTELADVGLGLVTDYLQPGSRTAQILTGGSELKLVPESVGKAAGVGLAITSGVFTAIDAEQKYGHLRNSDKADLLIDGVQAGLAFFEVSSPIGWAFGVGMFVGNLVSEHYTGKSITENLFANDNN